MRDAADQHGPTRPLERVDRIDLEGDRMAQEGVEFGSTIGAKDDRVGGEPIVDRDDERHVVVSDHRDPADRMDGEECQALLPCQLIEFA